MAEQGGQGYEAPAVEDRTTVDEPLNTAATQSEFDPRTPVWRRGEDRA